MQSTSSDGTTVLVLEDEPTLLELITEMLSLKGLVVTATNTAADARHHLTETTFDLFLTDIVVQGEFSGADLAREAQKQGRTRRIIVMSGHAKHRALAGHEEANGLQFLKKPFSYSELINLVAPDS